jgi:hypothetical protein
MGPMSEQQAEMSKKRIEAADRGATVKIKKTGFHFSVIICKPGGSPTAQDLLHVKTAIINGRLDRYTGHHSVPEDIAA